jgi:hypothetical protein
MIGFRGYHSPNRLEALAGFIGKKTAYPACQWEPDPRLFAVRAPCWLPELFLPGNGINAQCRRFLLLRPPFRTINWYR